jgi:hypothetical protein
VTPLVILHRIHELQLILLPTTCVQACLDYPISLTSQPGAGINRTLHFAWRLPETESTQFDVNSSMVSLLSRVVLPKILTAQEEERIKSACSHPAVQIDPSLMKFLLKSAGIKPLDKHGHDARTAKQHERIEAVLRSDEAFVQNLVAAGYNALDMRCLNGRAEEEAFNDFIQCVHKLLSERDMLASEERRKAGNADSVPEGEAAAVRPTALAPSLRSLHARVSNMMSSDPDMSHRLKQGVSKIPSVATFATFMSPSHPDRVSSDRYSGKAGIIFKMQSRTARKTHPDAHYNNMQALLLRHWMSYHAKRGVDILFISDDDKCKIAVGAPGLAQAVITRQRKAIAGPLTGILCVILRVHV